MAQAKIRMTIAGSTPNEARKATLQSGAISFLRDLCSFAAKCIQLWERLDEEAGFQDHRQPF